MIKTTVVCIIFIMITGCASIGELAVNAAGGAIGNMLDRRIEGELDNDVEEDDKKLENKIVKETK
tara:strand:- start:1849 stop:2043 length:195 start_codon:yes stop_codon:yes gene_type:complete